MHHGIYTVFIYEPSPVFFFSFYLHFFTKTEPVTWHQNPQDHNSHEHALENTSVHLACNTYTCQMFSVLEKIMSSLSVTSGQQNKVKMSLWEHVWCKMWNPKLPGVVLSCAGTRAEVQPWITRLTGSDWVELCRTLERTFVKNTVQASSFFSHTHINVVMQRSGTRLDLGCIAVDFCLCIDLHWVWFQ